MFIYPASSEIVVIVSAVFSFLIIMGGFVYKKLVKDSSQSIFIGCILFGVVLLILNSTQLWQVINGTFEPQETRIINVSEETGGTANANISDSSNAELSMPSFEILSMDVYILHLIFICIGLLTVIVGLANKKKDWAKVAILLGVASMLISLLQVFL